MYREFDYRNFRFYNGVNHDFNYYVQNPNDMVSLSRSGEKFQLTNNNAKPVYTEPKSNALSIEKGSYPETNIGGFRFELPKWQNRATLHINPSDYDVIIVSGMYANDAVLRAISAHTTDDDLDFLDRMYTPGPTLFDGQVKKGALSLVKVVLPNGSCRLNQMRPTPLHAYLDAYRNGRTPSLSAVMQYVDFLCKQNPSIVADPLYNELEKWIQNDIWKRTAGCMNNVYHPASVYDKMNRNNMYNQNMKVYNV